MHFEFQHNAVVMPFIKIYRRKCGWEVWSLKNLKLIPKYSPKSCSPADLLCAHVEQDVGGRQAHSYSVNEQGAGVRDQSDTLRSMKRNTIRDWSVSALNWGLPQLFCLNVVDNKPERGVATWPHLRPANQKCNAILLQTCCTCSSANDKP